MLCMHDEVPSKKKLEMSPWIPETPILLCHFVAHLAFHSVPRQFHNSVQLTEQKASLLLSSRAQLMNLRGCLQGCKTKFIVQTM
jgi:hypothetical protein